MYGTHQSLTAVHTILRKNDDMCLAEAWHGITKLILPEAAQTEGRHPLS